MVHQKDANWAVLNIALNERMTRLFNRSLQMEGVEKSREICAQIDESWDNAATKVWSSDYFENHKPHVFNKLIGSVNNA